MQTGIAAGVPYVALPPASGRAGAPVVVGWHLMSPPRTEVAFAAALPLHGLDAWRVYLGLPLTGSREPAGGVEALGYSDAVLDLFDPVVAGAVAEFPAALAALRERLGFGAGPPAVLGGSIGSLVAQQVAATTAVAATVLVSPVAQLRPVIEANGRAYGFTYGWTPPADAVAARLDFVARAAELTAPVLLVVGADDDPASIGGPAAALHAALPGSELVTVAGMGHALAEEPGTGAALQVPATAAVDAIVTGWLAARLGG